MKFVFYLFLTVAIAQITVAQLEGFAESIDCGTCKKALGQIFLWVRSPLPFTASVLSFIASAFCRFRSRFSFSACQNAIKTWTSSLEYIIENSEISGSEACGMLLDQCSSLSRRRLNVPIPDDKPEIDDKTGNGTLIKVLHFADLHLDVHYRIGSNIVGEYPLGCRSGSPDSPSQRAGAWGSYNGCDTPVRLLRSMLHQASQEHTDIQYILHTGDFESHDFSPSASRRSIYLSNGVVQAALQKEFPNVPIICVLGNHDTYPSNSFSPRNVPSKFSMKWLYEHFYKEWLPLVNRPLFPGKTQISSFASTFRKYGYYYTRVPEAKFRIIVLNTNLGYRLNFWWMLVQTKLESEKQLKWLVKQLSEAEQLGERVHIVGHIAPSVASTLREWNHVYFEIVKRFESTIVAQFYSHTHWDEFQVYKDKSGRAFSTVYIAPSGTPWINLNPGYKAYTMENEHFTMIDAERWMTDLNKANENPDQNPRWRKLFSARDSFQLESLHPEEWNGLAERMAEDSAVFDDVVDKYWGSSPHRTECNKDCVKKTLCAIVTGDQTDSSHCEKIKAKVK